MVTSQDIKRAARITRRNIKTRILGFKKYEGTPEEICRSILQECWDAENGFFLTSTGHFSEFWTRDFGICSKALVDLGYRIQVIKTLDYVLSIFSKNNRITTTISDNVPCDFPYYSADSLPLLIRAVKNSESKFLLQKHRQFLAGQIDYYFNEVFDRKNCMIREDRYFSSMKDLSKRKSSAYDNSMLFMLCTDLDELGFYNPFSSFRKRIKQQITKNLWNKNSRFFYDDLERKNVVAGDANVFPFWCGVFDITKEPKDKKMFESCLNAITKNNLDSPFPLKYSSTKKAISPMHFVDYFVGNYERNAVWMHLGLCFLDIIKNYNSAMLEKYLDFYRDSIKKYKTFLEVYSPKGKRFSSLLYVADEGMLWAGKYLHLRKFV